jgi:hypothetical protein
MGAKDLRDDGRRRFVRKKLIGLAVLLPSFFSLGFSEVCPKYSDKVGLAQFLVDHRAHSTEADPDCVMRAFAALRHEDAYTEFLVHLLDVNGRSERIVVAAI